MNSARGEQEIDLGGVKLTLALEYERIIEVEEITQTGLIALAGRFAYIISGENTAQALMISPIRLQDVVNALWILSGKQSGGKTKIPCTQEMIGKLVLKVGVINAIDPLSDFFATAIAGDPVGESEAGDQEPQTDDSQ